MIEEKLMSYEKNIFKSIETMKKFVEDYFGKEKEKESIYQKMTKTNVSNIRLDSVKNLLVNLEKNAM